MYMKITAHDKKYGNNLDYTKLLNKLYKKLYSRINWIIKTNKKHVTFYYSHYINFVFIRVE